MNGLLLNVQRRSSLFLSLMCAAYFLLLYTLELKSVQFGVNSDSICYLQSGLHGLHVICALIFVGTCYRKLQATSKNNLSLHFGAWYWHFVDISWLIVWIMIYMLPYIVVTIYSKQDSNNLADWDWAFEPLVMNGQRFINLMSAISFHEETAKLSDVDKYRIIKYLLNIIDRPFGKTDEPQIFLDSAQFGDNFVGFYIVQQQDPINRTVISMMIEDMSLISRANYLEKKISNLISTIPEKKLFSVAEKNIDLKHYLNLNSLLNMKGYMFFHWKALFTERKLSFIETYFVTKGELHVVSYSLNQNDPFDPADSYRPYTNFTKKLFANALLYLKFGTNEEVRQILGFAMVLIACEQVARFCFFFVRFYYYIKYISTQYPFAQIDQLNFFFSPETHACISRYASLLPEDDRSFDPLPLESLVVQMENILKLLEDCEESRNMQNIFDTWYWLYP
jgi:hypothetical protein